VAPARDIFVGDLDVRRLKQPKFVFVDRASGLAAALVAFWHNQDAENVHRALAAVG